MEGPAASTARCGARPRPERGPTVLLMPRPCVPRREHVCPSPPWFRCPRHASRPAPRKPTVPPLLQVRASSTPSRRQVPTPITRAQPSPSLAAAILPSTPPPPASTPRRRARRPEPGPPSGAGPAGGECADGRSESGDFTRGTGKLRALAWLMSAKAPTRAAAAARPLPHHTKNFRESVGGGHGGGSGIGRSSSNFLQYLTQTRGGDAGAHAGARGARGREGRAVRGT